MNSIERSGRVSKPVRQQPLLAVGVAPGGVLLGAMLNGGRRS